MLTQMLLEEHGLELALELVERQVKEALATKTWVTRSGRWIPVQKMSTAHIVNVLACWMGVGNTKLSRHYLGGYEAWVPIFQEELERR